jgi:uncharacterized OB-fold protein
VTEVRQAAEPYGDALSRPFWEGACRRELRLQRCGACGAHQLYPRPFCLECSSDDVAWVAASGRGEIYAMTTVRIQTAPELEPPYVVALVQLDEGPRMLGRIADARPCRIGSRVRVDWRDRGAEPPLPQFLPCEEEE